MKVQLSMAVLIRVLGNGRVILRTWSIQLGLFWVLLIINAFILLHRAVCCIFIIDICWIAILARNYTEFGSFSNMLYKLVIDATLFAAIDTFSLSFSTAKSTTALKYFPAISSSTIGWNKRSCFFFSIKSLLNVPVLFIVTIFPCDIPKRYNSVVFE